MNLYYKALLVLSFLGALNACSGGENGNGNDPAEVATSNQLGAYENLVGDWFVDAATAGTDVYLSFGADGSFSHEMADVKGTGSWKVINDEFIEVESTTQRTPKKWRISELDRNTVDICWNPESAKPKTIPFKRK